MKLLSASPLMLLVACALPDADPQLSAPDDGIVRVAMQAARPQPLIDLVDSVDQRVPVDGGCPVVLYDDQVGSQLWIGGCAQPDGTWVDGWLQLQDSPSDSWVAGQGFAVRGPQGLEFYLDGAVELAEQDGLLIIDAAATWCDGDSCQDGGTTVDLAYTLFPASGFPDAYDVTASGAVGTDDQLVRIDGTWSIDADSCELEPASGTVAIEGAARHLIDFDGALTCDACGAWVVQGRPAPDYCGIDL